VFYIMYFLYRLAMGWAVRESNPGGGEIFRTCPDRPWGPSSLFYNGYRVFHGGKKRPGRDADTSPPSSAVVMKGYRYSATPLWAVRPVQSLSTCTRENHFNIILPSMPSPSKWSLSLRFSHQNPSRTPTLPHASYMPHAPQTP
jgi:hypothetical protein